MNVDVTRQRAAEEEIERERERLGLALTAGKMGVFEVNPVAGALWWSLETYSLFGVNPETFKPTQDSFAQLIHPEERAQFMQYWNEKIAQHQQINRELRIRVQDG